MDMATRPVAVPGRNTALNAVLFPFMLFSLVGTAILVAVWSAASLVYSLGKKLFRIKTPVSEPGLIKAK
jgi:hypothetical protein